MRRGLALSTVLATLVGGCALAHEATDLADGGPITRDTGLLRLDAFVPPNDAFFTPPDTFVSPPDAWSFMIAPHAPEPVIPDQGGPRIAHPQIVVITFADDPQRATAEANARWIARSNWLSAVGAEYGVGDGAVLGVVERTDRAPTAVTDPQIASLIGAGITGGSIPVPTTGLGDALYAIYFPDTTTVTFPNFGTACTQFGGYHNSGTTPDGRAFSYAVIPLCHLMNPTISDVEWQEITLAHEVIEAATDPLPLVLPAWAFPQMMPMPSPWALVGGEVADLCELREGPSAYVHEAGFIAPRVWSNAAAAAGDRDPCVPNPSIPYVAVSITPDEILSVPSGSSTTLDVLGWSTAPAAPFPVFAYAAMATPPLFTPEVTIDRSMLANGVHATLTVRVPPGTRSGSYGVAYVVVQGSGMDVNLFPVGVFVP